MNKKGFGPIYARASNGKTKVWSAEVIDDIMYVTHGYNDGKKVTDEKQIKGKNIGKANETTPFDQACSEAQSKYNKKIDEGYMTEIDDVQETSIELPMLAHPFKDRSHHLKYPCYVQPKLNGVRCISRYNLESTEEVKVQYVSRKGKLFTTLEHLTPEVEKFIDEVSARPDGEIFNPEWGFQEIVRALKKQRETSQELEYWIYDIVDTSATFEERTQRISNFFDEFSDGENSLGFRKYKNLVEVPTYEVDSFEEAEKKHKEFTKLFEGTIFRNASGLYVMKHRSNDLLKYKDFLDAEFEIVGAHEGTGNDKGTVIFEVKTKEGKVFSVRPKGSRELRKEWLENINSLIGKELTVRYQELSEDGIPIFPVGLEIRDYE